MINWIQKTNGRTADSDVEVSISLRKSKRGQTAFSLSLKARSTLGAHEYIMVGEDKDTGRLYFKGSNKREGYHVCLTGAKTRCYLVVPGLMPSYVGDHDLLYDKEAEMFYVERRGK